MKPYYQDSAVTIYHGDCFDLLHELSGIGAVITDPPYSSGGAFRGDRAAGTVEKYVQTGTKAYRPEFGGDNRDQRSFLVWCSMWLNAARIATKPGSPLVSFIDWRQLPVLTDAVQAGGWTWRNLGTWWKPGCRMQSGRFSSSAEYVVYATNGPAESGSGSPQNVFSCAPVAGTEKEHIAQKPESVMSWVMQVVPPGSVVLDPFCGSGSTLRAAKNLELKSIGIDADERYCEIAARRMQQEVLPLYGAALPSGAGEVEG
jgi:site-specific DNA-methyltransferase (adenine-specific)